MMHYSTKLFNREKFRLLTEGRSVSIEIDTLEKMLLENCKDWCNKNLTSIYRGIDFGEDFMYIEPKNFNRKSKDMYNISIYQNVIDLSEKWEKFPKRSKSIICTTSFTKAEDFGFVYEVIPFDDAEVAVSPAEDIWFSFSTPRNETSEYDLMSLNNEISKLSLLVDGNSSKINSKEELINFCNKIDENIDILLKKQSDFMNGVSSVIEQYNEFSIDEKYSSTEESWSYNILLPQFSVRGTFKVLEDLLDPVKSNFKLISYDKFNLQKDISREVWTDSKCILIHSDKINWVMSNLL